MKKLFFALLLAVIGMGAVTTYSGEACATPNPDNALATYAFADSLFGKDFLDTAAYYAATGEHINPNEVMPIGFTRDQLRAGHALGEQLIFRKKGCTMDMLAAKYRTMHHTDLIDGSVEKLKLEAFFISETTEGGWYLVTKDIIPRTTEMNYLSQTERLRVYIADNSIFWDDGSMADIDAKVEPNYEDAYLQAAHAFDAAMGEITSHLSRGAGKKGIRDTLELQKATEVLFNLAINMSCRESAVDVFYREMLYYTKNKSPLFVNTYTWTKSRSADNQFIEVGGFRTGIRIGMDFPSAENADCGVAFCHGPHF
jgi:hypothetical protein